MNKTEINAWTEFAQELKKRIRWDREQVEKTLDGALKKLPELAAAERAELFKIGRVVAERSSKFALSFLRIAPKALSLISPSCRPVILRWGLILASASRETLIDFLERCPEIINPIAEGERLIYLRLGLRLAEEDSLVSFKYFLNIAKLNGQIPSQNMAKWVEEGRPLIRQNLSSALAYYSLESKFSHNKREEQSPAVSLYDIARPLKLFAQAVTGRSLSIRPLAELKDGLPPFSLFPCTDGEAIYLPLLFRDFSSQALNFSAYKLATAHQAGYFEFGTFNFKLSSVAVLFPPELIQGCFAAIHDRGNPAAPLEVFLQLFPKRNLAKDLFHALEGARIDHCLRREYRGLKVELDFFLQKALEGRPSVDSLPLQEGILESILQITAGGRKEYKLPAVVDHYQADLFSVLFPLLEKGATVDDSARATVILYRWLSSLPNFRLNNFPLSPNQKVLPWPSPSLFTAPGINFAPRMAGGEEPYRGPIPLPHRGQFHPELLKKKINVREVDKLLKEMEIGVPLSPEELKKLLESGLEIEVSPVRGEEEGGFQGLFLTDVEGLNKAAIPAQAKGKSPKGTEPESAAIISDTEVGEEKFYYDEWDYRIQDYRVQWCWLKEKKIAGGSADFVSRTIQSYADLVAEVRKQFQMLKPERLKRIPRLERGEEIDLNAAIEASVDRRAGHSPSEKIYIEKNRKERDFSTLFLLDMSASTDERINNQKWKPEPGADPAAEKKVIDIEREALVIMAEALREIGDEYAIFGFSGYGRKQVEFFKIKDFSENYGEEVKGRIEEVKPYRSTRMGPAIRHAVEKIAGRESKVKNIILISDGYPQDYDYGEDRAGKEYALQDTMMALEEAARKNIHTFCITVDRAGHDYLRQMCHPHKYLVIEETAALPRELPKIYRRLTT